MACSSADHQSGFATPAATVVCLAVATVTSASLLLATTRLREARAVYEKSRVEYALDGAQVSAAVMLEAQPAKPHVWVVGSPLGIVTLRAEPEDVKLSAGAASEAEALPDAALAALDVENGEALRDQLRALVSAPPSGIHLEDLDRSLTWKSCARRLVSPWGHATRLRYEPPTELAPEGAGAPVGQTWRIQAALDGWTDDRTVLLTGSPAPLLRERSFGRQRKGAPPCDEVLSGLSQVTPATP